MNVIHDHIIIAEEDEDLESSTAPERYMVVGGSIKSKLPPALVLKSCNLRVLDPIGQGTTMTLIFTKDTLLQY